MKTSILILSVLLFAGNTFAQTDSLSVQNGINVPQSEVGDLQVSEQAAQRERESNVTVPGTLKSQLEAIDIKNVSSKKLGNGVSSLEGNSLKLQEVDAGLKGTFNDFKLQIAEIKSELNKSIQGNSDIRLNIFSLEKKLNQLSRKFSSYIQDADNTIVDLREKIISNTKTNKQLTSKIELTQEESNKLEEYNDNLKKSLNDLENNYRQIAGSFATYKQNSDKALQSTLQKINTNSASIKKTADKLEARIAGNTAISNKKFAGVSQNISQQKKYFIAAFIAVILLTVILFFFLRKQIVRQQDESRGTLRDLRQFIEEEGVGHDQKLTELIEAQLKIQDRGNVVAKQEPNHSLALKVADEIIRIQKNLADMDAKTRGLKQLTASVKRIQNNFSANGYELVDMLGQPYKEGIKASVTFIPDDEFEAGQDIITRVIKPQVNYRGEMIQTAQIEVSQG